jgi:hypothetical protein
MKLPRPQFLHLAAGAAALPVLPPAAALGQGMITPTSATMIVERTQYFAKPGLAADVLDLRKASAVRLSIGLPAGEIFVKHPSGDGSEPDVAWQCTFGDAAAREADPCSARSECGIRERSEANEKTACAFRAAGLFDRRPLKAGP